MSSKYTNASKQKRQRREKRRKFAGTGTVVGLFAGLAFGFVAELVTGRGMIVMHTGGIVGVLLGAVVDGLRLLLRKRTSVDERR